jgi:membrane carboxypeptidase/penicillin-binding protein PbpC
VSTTLDAALQIAVEGVVAREARFLGDHANVSALVINNVTARFSPTLAGATISVRLAWSIWHAPCALPDRR